MDEGAILTLYEHTLSISPARKLRSLSASLVPLRGTPCPLGLRDGVLHKVRIAWGVKKVGESLLNTTREKIL